MFCPFDIPFALCRQQSPANQAKTNPLKHILKQYKSVSWQWVNYEKSKVAFNLNTPLGMREMIKRNLRMEIVSCYDKYLGLATVISKNRKNVFDVLKEKVAKKVGGWRERYFLVGG